MSTTNAGSLGVLVEADTASFDSAMSKVGAAAEREMKRAERAQAAAKAEGERFIAVVQRQVDTFGLTGAALLEYEARVKGVSNQVAPLIDKLNSMKAAQQAANQAFAGSGAGKGLGDVAAAADKAGHASAGMTRELIVLAHEASQGNFKRFGGSLLVLAEYSEKAQAAIRSLFGPIGLAVGAVAAFGLAAYEASKKNDELQRSILLTGNFAGTTAGQFDALAKSVSASTSSGIGKAADALQALVATGEVGPKALGQMAEATVKLEALTGKSADEIAKDFAKMQEAPTKWAAEANSAYNFLSVAQYDQIKALDEMGKHDEAAILVLQRLNEHLGSKLPDSLSGLGRALHSAGLMWDEFWHSAMHASAPEKVEDKLEAARKRLADLQKVGPRGQAPDMSEGMGRGRTRGDRVASLQNEIASLMAQASAEKAAAEAIAERAKAQKEGIAASDYFTRLTQESKGANRLKKDLDELAAAEKKRADARVSSGLSAVQPGDAAEHASNVAFITHRDRSFTDKADDNEAKRLANSIRERLQLYDEETAKLSNEGAQYTAYGKVLDQTAEAIARVDIETGKFAKASAADKSALIARAQAEDRAAAFAKQAKADAEAAAQRQKDSEALTKQLADQAIATDIEIQRLQDDTKFLSLNTLQRNIAIEALKIEKERRDELAKPHNAARADDINAAAADRTEKITNALTQADAAQKSFASGASKALTAYQENAANSAKFAENLIGGSLSRLEDSITTFAETGKLSFKSLFSFMADEFIRQQVRMGISAGIGGIGSVLGSVVGAIGGTGATASLANALPGDSLGNFLTLNGNFAATPLASGLDRVPYDGFPAILHQDETVLNRQQANAYRSGNSSGHTVNMTSTNNFGAGVDASTAAQLVENGNQRVKAEIFRALKTGRVAA